MSEDGEYAPNPQVRSALADMERTWTRLALEAEVTQRKKYGGLVLVTDPNPLPPRASLPAPQGS